MVIFLQIIIIIIIITLPFILIFNSTIARKKILQVYAEFNEGQINGKCKFNKLDNNNDVTAMETMMSDIRRRKIHSRRKANWSIFAL